MRQMSLDELQNRAKGKSIMIANDLNRQSKIRRRPRSIVEIEILGDIVVRRVQKARETGELMRVGNKLTIRL
jgi:hypothetical protein